MPAPDKIKLPGLESEKPDFSKEEIITAIIKGEKVMMTPAEAMSTINQLSGVLYAHELVRT